MKSKIKSLSAHGRQFVTRPSHFIFVFVFSILTLFFMCLIINFQYVPKAFLYDGLSSILVYEKFAFWDYINPFFLKGDLRIVTHFVFGIVLKLVGHKIFLIGPVLIAFNFLISLVVYYIATKISGRFLIGFCVALCYVLSHFAYYQVMETFGFMEGLALLFSLVLLYQLYQYINDENKEGFFYIALCFYLLAVLTHERYLVLFPVFVVAIVLRAVLQSENWKSKRLLVQLGVSALLFGLLLLVRFLLLGRDAMRGTGGTNVIDTFSVFGMLKNIFVQILALFGISYGPSYLMGTSTSYFSASDWILVGIYSFCVLTVLVWVLVLVIKNKHLRKAVLSNVFLFGSFILGCMVSCSTTLRLEMRWIYVSQMAFLLMISYLIKIIIDNSCVKDIRWKPLLLTVPLVFSLCFGVVKVFYRQYWPNLYIMEWLNTSTTYYETLVEPYGEDLNGRDIIFVYREAKAEKLQALANSVASYFQQFGLSPGISFVNSFYDLSEEDIDGRKIIIYVKKNNPYEFIDLTGASLKVDPETGEIWDVEGVDGDGWTGAYFSFKTLTGDSGTIALNCIASRAEPGDTVMISVNGVKTSFEVDSIYISFSVQAKPNTVVEVVVESSFSIVTSPDTRYQSLLVQEIVIG